MGLCVVLHNAVRCPRNRSLRQAASKKIALTDQSASAMIQMTVPSLSVYGLSKGELVLLHILLIQLSPLPRTCRRTKYGLALLIPLKRLSRTSRCNKLAHRSVAALAVYCYDSPK